MCYKTMHLEKAKRINNLEMRGCVLTIEVLFPVKNN